MWTCLYGFVLDILCVKYIICTLKCDMRNMSKFSIFFCYSLSKQNFPVHKQRISPSGHQISAEITEISPVYIRISFFEFKFPLRSEIAKFGEILAEISFPATTGISPKNEMVNPDVESAERRVEERREWGKNPGADRWVLRFRRDMRERESVLVVCWRRCQKSTLLIIGDHPI